MRTTLDTYPASHPGSPRFDPTRVRPVPGGTQSRSSFVGSDSILSDDQDLHLLRRATFGPTPTLLADIRQRGAATWLDEQLQPAQIDDAAMDSLLRRYTLISAPLSQLLSLTEPRLASTQLVAATFARQVWSKRQLFEVMVDFWSNHFNVFTPHVATYITKPIEDRSVIRPNALGRFEDLLLASAKSPAMLAWLNNEDSQKDEPNENYGRELLQLYTVSPAAGYSEADVLNSARILTGRSTDDLGSFLYKKDSHHVGTVKVMTWSSANASATGGMAVGDSYLRYLARHEQTAHALSRKLAIRFVSDDPPPALVEMLAGVYLDGGTAIVPWLRALFESPEFAAAVGRKTRRPTEDIIVTARVLGLQPPTTGVKPIGTLVADCGRMGQPPLGEFEVTGYSDVASGWYSVSATLGLCNLHRSIARGYPKTLPRPELSTLLAGPAMATHGAMVDRLSVALTGQTLRTDHRNALLAYAGMTASQTYNQASVNLWLADLTEMVLDSPYLKLR
ncbi:MAG: DUF1800 domain-containing protein [Geodermatophilaceae bacterium]|nr:DUF1800 domain-containing protein [Geodermatophilaceae bacterium]